MTKDGFENQKDLLSINKTIEELLSSIKNTLPNTQHKLDKFVNSFNKEFSTDTKPEDRGRAEATTWALMGGPLVLYALDMNGSAIIELNGILEGFATRDIVRHIANPLRKSIVSKVIQKHTLPKLALMLYDLEIFDKEDVKFTKKLNRLRNGVAHKNPKIISDMVCSGRRVPLVNIDSIMTNIDCVPLIIKTIRLLVKMSKS